MLWLFDRTLFLLRCFLTSHKVFIHITCRVIVFFILFAQIHQNVPTVIGIHLTWSCIKTHIRRSLICNTLVYGCTVNTRSFFLSLRFKFSSWFGYKRLIKLFFVLPCHSVLHDAFPVISICWRFSTTSFLDWFCHRNSTIIHRIIKFIRIDGL